MTPLAPAPAQLTTRLFLASMVAIGLMLVDHRLHHLDNVRQLLGAIVYPLHWSAQLPLRTAHWLDEHLTDRQDLLAELAGLRAQQLLLQGKLQQLGKLEAENQRLRALLESADPLRRSMQVVPIMAVDLGAQQQRLMLDVGGLQIGQVVLDAHGLVGQVLEATPVSAVVMLITDPRHALPVQVARNGLRTVAVGTGEGLYLPYLARNPDVVAGDILLSSGLGGIYPAGYPVALVTQTPMGNFGAKPLAQMARNRELLVLGTEVQTPAP